jgi:hypothetical protein
VRTTSPGRRKRGGCIIAPTPPGVPVVITSPGSSVKTVESTATCSKQSKIGG